MRKRLRLYTVSERDSTFIAMDTIQEGDIVTLFYRYPDRTVILEHQKVMYVAHDVGDLWRFQEPSGTFYEMNSGFAYFDKMVKETPNV